MRVCFSVGPMSSRLISSISKSADNIEFSTYSNIAEMVKESKMRRIFFDRIVFSEKILKNSEKELQVLNDYISEFSDNTKIVFICQGTGMKNVETFNSLFDSPLYTVVLVEKVTTSILLEFVKGDIAELKAKYYSLDVKGAKVVKGKYAEQGGTESNVVEEKPKKKGFLKSLFGGKKNNPPKVENQNSIKESSTTEGKGSETVSKNHLDLDVESIPSPAPISGVIGAGATVVAGGLDVIKNSADVVPGLGGVQNLGSENSYNDLDIDNLSIGDLGEQHIDTGFLDDEAENEIEEVLRNIEKEENLNKGYNEDITPVLEKYDEVAEEPVIEDTNSNIEVPLSIRDNKGFKYRLVIGERGVGATSYIIDNSANLASKGKKVLIVDLDYINNGVLSYIDSDKFYDRNYNNGIDNLSMYNEDGVDILSNGFSTKVSKKSLDILVHSRVLDRYDVVFIDCPVDCIDVLSEDLVFKCISMIKVGGNKGSLMALLGKLTNRDCISPKIEDILFKNSKFVVVNKIEYYLEDLTFLKKLCFFSRGDWLSKLN